MAHKTAMDIQTYISHILQSKHIQGILVDCVENYHNYKCCDHPYQ